MENKGTCTNDSHFADVSELEKKIQYLEDELMQANAKMASLDELLLLTENVLSRCRCHVLQEQVSSLLSSMQRFMSKTASDASPTVSALRLVDVAVQCDGEYLVSSSLVTSVIIRCVTNHNRNFFHSSL